MGEGDICGFIVSQCFKLILENVVYFFAQNCPVAVCFRAQSTSTATSLLGNTSSRPIRRSRTRCCTRINECHRWEKHIIVPFSSPSLEQCISHNDASWRSQLCCLLQNTKHGRKPVVGVASRAIDSSTFCVSHQTVLALSPSPIRRGSHIYA